VREIGVVVLVHACAHHGALLPSPQVRENGVVVLVPRYGIEGIVYVAARGERSAFAYDAKTDALIAPGCTLRTFDKVRVAISVDQSRAHRPKLQLAIIEPVLPRA